MKYKREINDNPIIQIIILSTMCKIGKAVRYDDLMNIIFENCNINYGEFQIALEHLIEIGYITKSHDLSGCDVFCVLPEGRESNQFLEGSLPVYIKEPIAKYIAPYFHEEESRQKVRAEIEEIRPGEYNAILSVYDDDTLALMKLEFYAGSRSEAMKIAKNFDHDPENIYRKILNILVGETDDSENG